MRQRINDLTIALQRCCCLVVVLLIVTRAASADSSQPKDAILTMSIEDLMDVEVFSVSKRKQQIGTIASAVSVIDENEIRQSGARSLPEILRLIPGVQVSQINATNWAVSIRGSNGQFSNKLQVLIDGQSVYSFGFSGVFWNDIDIPIEQIKRVEVLKGPGGAIWGANAVNGVINVITKNSAETQGTHLTLGGGNYKESLAMARHGFELSENNTGRIYVKQERQAPSRTENNEHGYDGATDIATGVRFDLKPTDEDTILLKADVFNSVGTLETVGATGFIPTTVKREINTTIVRMFGKWDHALSNTSEFSGQLDVSREDREYSITSLVTDTLNLGLQYNLHFGDSQELTIGTDYRHVHDDAADGTFLRFDPNQRNHDIMGLYVQHQIDLIPDSLTFTSGLRLDRNDFTGWEYQPNLRLIGRPSESHSVWGSYSRATRTPSRVENDMRFVNGLVPIETLKSNALLEIQGSTSTQSENLTAYELGYRFVPRKNISVDLASYYFQYDDLTTIAIQGDPTVDISSGEPRIIIPLGASNAATGSAYGGEVSLRYNPTDWWRASLGYSYIETESSYDQSTQDIFLNPNSFTPKHAVIFRTGVTVLRDIELDSTLRYVGSTQDNLVDPYFQLDVRIGVPLAPNVLFAIVGQNLISDKHREFSSISPNPVQVDIPRGVYGKITWTF